jgi:hypothetical protein
LRHCGIKEDVRSFKVMASLLPARAASLVAFSPSGDVPGELAQFKLSRLRELRAVVDSLRCEREARDPLLSWVVEQEKAGTQPPA